MDNEGLSEFSEQYRGKDFTEREGISEFSGNFNGFGELPEDLRGMGPVSTPDGTFIPGFEGDIYSTSYTTGFSTGTGGRTSLFGP